MSRQLDTQLPWPQARRIVSRIQLPRIPDRVVAVRPPAHGGDIRPAVLEAIDACSAAGGGRVVVPCGSWRSEGPIHLRSRVELHLEPGCYIKFSPQPALYLPVVATRWEGVNILGYSPAIYGYELEDVAITGGGVIDGGAEVWNTYRQHQRPAQERVRTDAGNGVPLQQRVYGEQSFLRPSMCQLVRSNRVLIEGVTFINASFWMVHPVYCRDVTIRGICCDSMFINNDGIDIDSCADVLIEECVVRSGDDGIAMKSGRDKDAWDTGLPTRDVVIRNCAIPEALHGFAVGSEMSGGVENVFVHNCEIGHIREEAIQFKSNRDRGAYIRHVRLENVSVERAGGHFVFFTNDYHGYRGGNAPTQLHDITLTNASCGYAANAIHMHGLAEQPLRNIVLRNLTVAKADRAFSCYELADECAIVDSTVGGVALQPPRSDPRHR